jgi:hypothetical protein
MASSVNQPRPRIVLDGFQEGAAPPKLAIHAIDEAGRVIATVAVSEDGSFSPEAVLTDKTDRIRIGPADIKPDQRRGLYTLPAADARRMLAADSELAIAGRVWQPWYPIRRCVGGNVRRCRPSCMCWMICWSAAISHNSRRSGSLPTSVSWDIIRICGAHRSALAQ